MILIYSKTTSPRLLYVCNFIFIDILHTNFTITIDTEAFKNYTGAKINYSNLDIDNYKWKAEKVNLLFENTIKQQAVECFTSNGYKTFFKTENSCFSFDIFAATFYLISRYEEYLPHTKDVYGRYAHQNALAFNQGFLHLPLINIWVNDFAKKIKQLFPTFCFQLSAFMFIPTYDIDIAFSFKHKGLIRNAGGFIKSPSLQRIKVLFGLQKDPFDSFKWIDDLHQKYFLHPIFFFLMAKKNGLYDKNILPRKKIMLQLIKFHAKKYTVGIHPSWQSGDDNLMLKQEIKLLDEIINSTTKNHHQPTLTHSRQHYIRFNLPYGYQRLIEVGVTDDYSMGYGSINGFRASVATPFFWYDLQKEEQTNLRIHPFCFMEANSFYEQKYAVQEALNELLSYYNVCKKVNGTLITIWHNNFLGTAKEFDPWRKMYAQFIKALYE